METSGGETNMQEQRRRGTQRPGFPLAEPGPVAWPALRRRFYERFALGLEYESELLECPPRLCWCDRSGAFNQLWLFPYLSPTPRRPDIAWVLQIALNGLDPFRVPAPVFRRLGVSRLQPDWFLELGIVPEELSDFADWLPEVASAHDTLRPGRVPREPHPFVGIRFTGRLFKAASAWSRRAHARREEFREKERMREELLHLLGPHLVRRCSDGLGRLLKGGTRHRRPVRTPSMRFL